MLAFRYRFHGHGSLRYVYKNGTTVRNHLFTVRFTHNPRRKNSRFAVVVSKKIAKSAVVRNRIRRRVFEALRATDATNIQSHDIVVIMTSSEVATVEFKTLTQMLFDIATQNILSPSTEK